MRVNIKKTTEILNDDLSLVERGILITILLLRESDSDLTLFKVKKNIKLTSIKEELVSLQDKGYITWSGYKTAKRSFEQKEINPKILNLITFMNNLYRRRFEVSPGRITLLTALLKKYSEEEIKSVIANRYSVWKDEDVMKVHLVPETVFRMSKFIKYLEDAKDTKQGQSYLKAEEISLKEGDEITYEIAETFIDSEVYIFKSYEIDSKGFKNGLGLKESRYGKDIKKLLKIQKNNNQKNFILTYIEK